MRKLAGLLGLVLICAHTAHAETEPPPSAAEQPPSAAEQPSEKKFLADASYYRGIEPLLPTVSDDAFTFNWHNRLEAKIRPWAFLRLGYENVNEDSRYNFVGRNNGFFLDSATIGMDATLGGQLSMRISLEAATEESNGTNTPQGDLNTKLDDGFGRWDPIPWVGVQGGQFKVPFAAEEMRSRADLLFVSRAVGVTGVGVNEGFEQNGLAVGRQVGAMLSSHGPVPLSRFGLQSDAVRDFAVAYYFMGFNGNGQNQFINDNNKIAFDARLEGVYSDIVTVGAAYLNNDRKVGEPPNQYDENDDAFDVDLLVTPFHHDLEVYFQFVQFDTSFPTVGVSNRTQQAWHVQTGYKFHTPWFHITPTYRYAEFDPWANGGGPNPGGLNLSSYKLEYHTFGFRLGHNELPMLFFFNYTITGEQSPNKLDNDLLQLLVQVSF